MADSVTDQSLRNRWRERSKLELRGVFQRFDLSVSRGVYVNNLAKTLAAHSIDGVLDIGANVGQYAVGVRRAGFEGRIISCEPLSGAYSELSRRASRDELWTALNVAVGRSAGEIEINVSANSYSSSVLPMTAAHLDGDPRSAYIAVEKVPMLTVVDLLEQHHVDPASTLLKIDTQGYEAEVLAGAGNRIAEFAALQLEISFVELYEGQPLAEDTVAQLRDWGYRLQTLEPGFSGPDGRLLQCDVLAVRGT